MLTDIVEVVEHTVLFLIDREIDIFHHAPEMECYFSSHIPHYIQAKLKLYMSYLCYLWQYFMWYILYLLKGGWGRR